MLRDRPYRHQQLERSLPLPAKTQLFYTQRRAVQEPSMLVANTLLATSLALAGAASALQKISRTGRYLYGEDGNRFYIKVRLIPKDFWAEGRADGEIFDTRVWRTKSRATSLVQTRTLSPHLL